MNDETIDDALAKNRRLAILHLLYEQGSAYTLNTSQITLGLKYVGIRVAGDVLIRDLRLMAGQGIIKVSDTTIEDIHIAELTKYGNDVRQGLKKNPIIARGGPHA